MKILFGCIRITCYLVARESEIKREWWRKRGREREGWVGKGREESKIKEKVKEREREGGGLKGREKEIRYVEQDRVRDEPL